MQYWAMLLPFLAFSVPVQGAEAVSLLVLGFSPTGSHFGFEQFGRQIQTNYPFSEIIVVETGSAKPAEGAPVRTLVARPEARTDQARILAYTGAKTLVESLRLTVPGTIALQAKGNDRLKAQKSTALSLPGKGAATMSIESVPVKAKICEGLEVKGVALHLKIVDGSGAMLWDFPLETPPIDPINGCPVDYGLADVRVLAKTNAPPVVGAVVTVYRQGILGSDLRYLAMAADMGVQPVVVSKGGH